MIPPRAGVRGSTFLFTVVLWLAGAVPATGQGPDDENIRYAQIMPLAPESLLLDITRNSSGEWVAVGERGHVVRRVGDEWIQAESVPTRATLTSITASAGRLWAGGHDTTIIRSDDGGQTWSLQYFDPERQQPILDLHFVDAESGFAIGAYGLFLVTGDGGETWEDSYVSDEEWHLNELMDLGDGLMMIAGEAGLAYLSEDGGENWEVIELPYPGSMWGATRTAGGCVLMYGLRGHVLETCDGGSSWEELESGTEASLGAGTFSGGVTLLAGNSGVILERHGRGPFEMHTHASGADFSGVMVIGDRRWVLVGEDGAHHYPSSGRSREPAAP